jgi:lactate dehydrogenase-like 2-hydroxyacid dehydrogenase
LLALSLLAKHDPAVPRHTANGTAHSQMDACKELRYVGVTATGYNMVDLDAAK